MDGDRRGRGDRPLERAARARAAVGGRAGGRAATSARRWAGRSSWRTMRSPVRAVAGQWMRRRSSPSRYSRIVTSSSPCRAMRCACSPSEPTPALGLAVRRQRVHGRQHDEVGGPLEHGVAVGEAEGVLHLHPEGAEVVASAQVGAHGVVDRRARGPAGCGRRRSAAGRRGRSARRSSARKIGVVVGRDVLERERDVGVLADADPLGVGVSLDAHPGLAGAHEHRRDERERDEEHAEAGEVAEAEDDAGERRGRTPEPMKARPLVVRTLRRERMRCRPLSGLRAAPAPGAAGR